MERFTNAFEGLLAALADAVKQLGEGSQQPWARTRVEEAKQDFVNCCDVMCFQLKQAVEMIRQEMLQHAASPGQPQGPAMDSEQVRQVLVVAEQFAAQLRSGGAVTAAAAVGAAVGDGPWTTTTMTAAAGGQAPPTAEAATAVAGMQVVLPGAADPAAAAAQGAATVPQQPGGFGHPQQQHPQQQHLQLPPQQQPQQLPPQQQQPHLQLLAGGGGGYGAYM